MMTDRLAFALWNASLRESDILVLRRRGRLIELQLGGGAAARTIVLRKRD